MKSDQKPRILVLDADMVPTLTISRSLSRRRCLVDVASHTARPLSSFSNTVRSLLQYPDPLLATDQFVEWLSEHCYRKHYDLVIPVTERTLVPLSRSRDRLQHVKIAMPAAQSLEVVLDKSRTLALAEKLGVPGIMYLIGELNRMLGKNADAVNWFSKVVKADGIENFPNIEHLARDAWEKITEAKHKNV